MTILPQTCFVVSSYFEDGNPETPASATFDLYGYRDPSFISRLYHTVCRTDSEVAEFAVSIRRTSPDRFDLIEFVSRYALNIGVPYTVAYEEGDGGSLYIVTTLSFECMYVTLTVQYKEREENLLVGLEFVA